ncbi:hypothetical protein HYV89_00390 [Candidatus Woesearchaeota archaeon]|nr:hypothetical protein [Candidatus Woesearchaeota archaeon]
MQKKLLHAQIKNPLLVRKTLLESAISTAEILRSMQVLRKIKAEENRKKAELKGLFEEVRILRAKLEEKELPPLGEIKHEKINKNVPKKILIREEVRKQRNQERILGKETEKSGIDLEIDNLREKIRNL